MVDDMLRILVFQLAVTTEMIPEFLEELYGKHHQKHRPPTQPSVPEWTSTLPQISEDIAPFDFVIDALDECREIESLMNYLRGIATRSSQLVKWLLTC